MFFVRDKGRMCNNLLQYGHVYAWGREHGRRTVSMRFAYKYPYFHISTTRFHNFAVYALAKGAAAIGLLPRATFNEPDGSPEAERLMERKHWLMVEGWYVRHYDLFLKYKKEILELFAFNAATRVAVEKVLQGSEGHLRLGLHIRRGDYRTWQNGKYFFSDDVYISYVKRFAQQHADKPITVYICGNDPKLDKEKYCTELSGIDVCFPNGNPGEDLCLLSACDYLIGAPSTFSLVAAMYHDRPLCWMQGDDKLQFDTFDHLFRHIL